jgi:hypothetical protein
VFWRWWLGVVQVLNASGNQDQPESYYLNECVVLRGMLKERAAKSDCGE